MRTVLVRGGKEQELVQEDKHFSALFQVSDSRYLFTQSSSENSIFTAFPHFSETIADTGIFIF